MPLWLIQVGLLAAFLLSVGRLDGPLGGQALDLRPSTLDQSAVSATARSDKTAFATDTPDLGALEILFATCSPLTPAWNRLDDADRVRYARWDGQDADGRKHQANLPEGKLVFPFENASDVRVFCADDLINEHVDYLTEGFWRATERVQGNPETEKDGRATHVRKLMNWLMATKLRAELTREIELFAQNGCTYGPSLLQVGWRRTLSYRIHTLKMDALMEASARRQQAMAQAAGDGGAPMDVLTLFPQLVLDPTLEADAVLVLQQIYDHYVEVNKPGNYDWDTQPLTNTRARRAIRELRTDGQCELPLPYLCQNEPFVRARKLWEDAYVPDSASSIQESPAVFLFDYYPEALFRAKGKAEGWDEDWVEAAAKEKGKFTSFRVSGSRLPDGTVVTQGALGFQTEPTDLIEVITCQRKLVDEDGVLQVFETVYHGSIKTVKGSQKESCGKHGPMDFPLGTNYPLVEWRFETPVRALCGARGIPQVVATDQQTLKIHTDMLVDRANMETVPARLVDANMGVNYIYGPAIDVPIKKGQMKPEYLGLPATTRAAENLRHDTQRGVDRYYGRPGVDEPPELALVKRQKRARSFLLSCSQALSFCFKLMGTQYPPEKIQQITGLEGGVFGTEGDIEEDLLYVLTYDVQEMSPDFTAQKNKALVEIAAMDSSGTIDRGALTRRLIRSVDPEVEAEICVDVQGAQGQVLKQVKDDFLNMLAGVPAQYTENDPTAPMQLQFAQQLIETSPKYQLRLQQDENFKELVGQWVKNKQFSLSQMNNKQIGRLGVDPGQQQPAA